MATRARRKVIVVKQKQDIPFLWVTPDRYATFDNNISLFRLMHQMIRCKKVKMQCEYCRGPIHAKPKVVEFRLLYNCKPVLLYKRRSKG